MNITILEESLIMGIENKFVFESMQDSDTIKNFLESLVYGFQNNKINLSTEGEEIELSPKGLLNFSVKAKVKGESNKISIKISWKDKNCLEQNCSKTIKIAS